MLNAEPVPAALDALNDDYEVLRELGRGGTAVVYLARERTSGHEVAIKLVRSQFAEDDEAIARLTREARFVAQLQHPNVVPVRNVLDLGQGGVALVMEHVPGCTLRQLLHDEGALAPDRVVSILRDVAAGLGAAHDRGIVHRDVKPENVFIGEDGHALLADFGIARSMSSEVQQLTMHGVAIGTPAYMAPEQIDGDELDARADVYSLGLLGWEMLTGKRPFAGEALYSVLYHQKHVQLDDPRAHRSDVATQLVSALAGAVEKERDARWASARQFLDALDGATDPREWPASPMAGAGTVRVQRLAEAVPAESVVAIDWRGALAAEARAEPPVRTRRRLAIGSGAGALAALALVVSAVRIHSRDATSDEFRMESAGQVALAASDAPKAAQIAVVPAAAAMAAPTISSPATPHVDSAVKHGQAPKAAASPITAAPAAAVTSPKPVAAPPMPAPAVHVRVAVGGRHSCLLAEDGRAFCWGGNDRGQLGIDAGTRLTAPATPAGNVRFVSIASGLSHSCGLAAGGEAYCWGDNDAGQLGDGTSTSRDAPVRGAGRHEFHAIAAGGAFACALDTDAAAWCWGSNSVGQLGDRAASQQDVPVRVAGNHRFTTLAVGWTFACALDSDSHAWCWGSDASGQLGDSAGARQHAPVRVSGDLAFTAIAAGSAHACGIATDGSAWCWGSDSNGQLGNGESGGSHTAPVRVRSTTRFSSIAAGAVHTCALGTGGEAWCWGSNVYGQLGNGGDGDSAVPVRVAGDHAFTALRAFGSHNCGVTSTSEAFCWGYNLDGQLGDGTRTHRSRPVYVQRPAAP